MPVTSDTSARRRAPGSARGVRDRLLDAAEARLLGQGPSALVLDAVARDAGVSKGGLLYHFPSKDDLVVGLIDRMLDNFDREQNALAAADGERAGRWTRAYLASTVTDAGEPADNSAQLMAGILAAIGNDPTRLQVVRQRFAKWHGRLAADGIDPTNATIVRLVADGLWLSALLGLPGLAAKVSARVLAALRDLTRP
jgi:AcrR family transcriptional regulator